MTGFGSADGTVLGGRLSIEIRSVNHRYYNPQLKLPFELGGVEGPLRDRLRQLLERGHVTVTARWIDAPLREGGGAVAVDLARARQVLAAAKELKKHLKLKGDVDLAFVARQPEVLTPHQDGIPAAQWGEVAPIAERAVRKLLGFLAQELLREVNTIGSKANDAGITQAVIAMKGELEKFREQLDNLE